MSILGQLHSRLTWREYFSETTEGGYYLSSWSCLGNCEMHRVLLLKKNQYRFCRKLVWSLMSGKGSNLDMPVWAACDSSSISIKYGILELWHESSQGIYLFYWAWLQDLIKKHFCDKSLRNVASNNSLVKLYIAFFSIFLCTQSRLKCCYRKIRVNKAKCILFPNKRAVEIANHFHNHCFSL